MKRLITSLLFTGLAILPITSFAADSYRWLHVTIDTPWMIFLFLLPMVLIPAILMAILYWKFAGRTPETEKKTQPAKSNSEVVPGQNETID